MRPEPPIALARRLITAPRIWEAKSPGSVGAPGALGFGSFSFVGTTISGLPSPVMSPAAGVLIDSAHGTAASQAPTRRWTGKPDTGVPSPCQA